MDQGMMSLIWVIAVGVLMYYFMIRPQQKQKKVKDAMMNNLKKGDRVITVGGMYGIVRSIKDEKVTLEIASEVYVQFSKGSIGSVLKNEPKSSKDDEPETVMDQETGVSDVDDVEYEIEQDQDE